MLILISPAGDGQVRSGLCEGDDLSDRGCAAGELLCQQPARSVRGYGSVPRPAKAQAADPVQALRPATVRLKGFR